MVFDRLFKVNIQNLAERGKFEKIASIITSDNPGLKRDAVSVLAKTGGEAYEHLGRALSNLISPQEQVFLVRDVYFILADNPEEFVRFILASPENIRGMFRKHIITEGKPDLAALHLLYDKNDPHIRRAAIATADILGKEGFDIILSGLFDRDPDVASESAFIFEHRDMVPNTPKEKAQYLFVRKRWNELVLMGRAGLPILIRLLKEGEQKERRDIIKALGRSRNPDVLTILRSYLRDTDPLIVGDVVSAIAEMGGPEAEGILEGCLSAHYPLVRMEASWGLERMGWKPKNDQLRVQSLLAREDWGGLARLGKTAIPGLINALREPHSAVRSGATETLRIIGSSAIQALRQVASSSDPNLVRVAQNALDEIEKKNQQSVTDSHAQPIDNGQYKKELAESLKAQKKHEGVRKRALLPFAETQKEAVHSPKPDESTKKYAEELADSLRAQEEFRKLGPEKPDPVGEMPDLKPIEAEKELEAHTIMLGGLHDVLTKMYGHITPKLSVHDEDEIRPVEKNKSESTLAESIVKADPLSKPLPPLQMPDDEEDEPDDKDNFEKLVTALSNRNTQVRISACYALRLYREKAVTPLISTLGDPIVSVRVAAIEALGEIADPECIQPLIDCIGDEEPDVKIAAITALGSYQDPDVIHLLVSLLNHNHHLVSSAASTALVKIRFPAIPVLSKALNKSSIHLRINAAATLGKMEDQDVVPILMGYLEDPSEEMRGAIARALARIGYPVLRPLAEIVVGGSRLQKLSALSVLGRMTEDEAAGVIRQALGDPDQSIRNYALQMLRKRESLSLWRSAWVEQLGESVPKPKGIPRLKKEDKELYDQSRGDEDVRTLIQGLRDNNRNVQFASAMKLTVMGRPAIEELLKAVKTESPEIRALAEDVIGEMREVAVEPLIEALYDDSSVIRAISARNLGRIGSTKSIGNLMRTFETEQDNEVRAIIVEALGYIGTSEVVPILKRALHDREEDVRLIAARALGYINNSAAIDALMGGLDNSDIRISEAVLTALRDQDGTPQEHLVQAMIDSGGFRNKNISSALTSIGWAPETTEEEVCFLISENRWFEIEKMGRTALQPIIESLDTGSVEGRIEAIKTIAHIGGQDAVHALIGILSDEHIMVRKKAEYALIDLGELAVEPLKALIGDEPGSLDRTVHRILKQIESKRLAGGSSVTQGEADFSIGKTKTIESILAGKDVSDSSNPDKNKDSALLPADGEFGADAEVAEPPGSAASSSDPIESDQDRLGEEGEITAIPSLDDSFSDEGTHGDLFEPVFASPETGESDPANPKGRSQKMQKEKVRFSGSDQDEDSKTI